MSAINEVPLDVDEFDIIIEAVERLFTSSRPLPAAGDEIRSLIVKLDDFASMQRDTEGTS